METDDKSINLPDLFRYLASHWKWYLLSVSLFMGYYAYDYSQTSFVYNRSATVMIRTPDNSPETVRMRRYNSFSPRIDGAAEILQLRTKELMRSAVARIHADVSYTVREGLRRKELYTNAPVTVSFPDAGPRDRFSFEVTPKDSTSVELEGFPSSRDKVSVSLNDTVSTPVGRMVITASANYTPACMGIPVTVTKSDREAVVGYFLSNLVIFQPESTVPILRISINDKSASRATDMLYTLINTFNEKSIEEKNRVAVNTSKFISDRLSIIERDLGHVESSLEVLKEKNAGLDINTAAGLYISESREYRSANKELATRLQLVGYMKQYLESETKIDGLIPNNTGLGSAEIEKQIAQYNNVVLKRNRLAEGNSRNNPVVQEVDRSLSLMRGNLLSAVENLYNSLELVKDNSYREEDSAREKIRAIPVKQREMLSVERQQKVKEDLYIFLLNKREENALNGAMTDSNARIIDSPSGSESPVYPGKFRKMSMGAGCGLILPTLVLLLLFKFDTRVHSRRDIEGVVSVPFVGCIPQAMDKKGESPVMVGSRGGDPLSESFRILRSNLGFIGMQSREKQVITCLSFNPGAGKTFVSLNLAVCLSLGGKKTIVLDLDLRKATLSYLTGTRRSVGISQYLSDETVTVDEIIQHNILGAGIDVIPAGAIPPNPSELLMSDRLDKLVGILRDRYDYVLVDNVPVGMVADSTITDRVSDISLFIVRAGKLDRRQLPELERLYGEHKLKNMAVLLNGVKKQSGYGYGYGYGYGDHRK